MDSTGLLNRFRSDVRDLGVPPLWTDADIYSYETDAQNMFCRLTGGLADATSAATTISYLAGDEFCDLSPRILKIRNVRRSDGYTVELLNIEDLDDPRMAGDYGMVMRTYKLDDTQGAVRALVVGMEPDKARFLPIPDASGTLRLTLYRLPLLDITGAGQALEVQDIHHEHLLLWMKRCAHLKQDAETYDRGKAERFGQEFQSYCMQAKLEKERKEHKHRSVSYGGL